MTKNDFLEKLAASLSGLPQADIDDRIDFYGEMIADRMEEGMTEEQAVASFGAIKDITAQIVADTPLVKIVKQKVEPKRALHAWEIVLLILGFPLWFPLLTAAAAILLSVYAVIWSLLISVWAVGLSLLCGSLAAIAAGVLFAVRSGIAEAVLLFGAGLVLAGLTLFAFLGCVAATKGIIILTKKALNGIKYMIIGREKTK